MLFSSASLLLLGLQCVGGLLQNQPQQPLQQKVQKQKQPFWRVELRFPEDVSVDFKERHRKSRFYGIAPEELSLSNRNIEPELVTKDVVDSSINNCFLLHGVLSPDECENIIRITEEIGFEQIETGVLNNNAWLTCILDEFAVERPLFERCRDHLPTIVEPSDAGTRYPREVAGLNQRCRFYRYLNDNYETFKPHRDDPNPGAGFVHTSGAEVDSRRFDWDADGERLSLLTFLLYLNDDFDGGETTFFLEDGRQVAVKPVQGSVLVFPQTAKRDESDAELERANANSPLHEGSRTRPKAGLGDGKTRTRSQRSLGRPKYAMRSDVLYGRMDDGAGWRFGELEDP